MNKIDKLTKNNSFSSDPLKKLVLLRPYKNDSSKGYPLARISTDDASNRYVGETFGRKTNPYTGYSLLKKHQSMGRHDSKHKKKSSHKKSHKKEKKRHKKKSKHYKKDCGSSSSDLSSDSSPCGPAEERELEKPDPEGVTGSNGESGWDDIFSDRCTTVKEKNVQKKDRHVLDQPGQSSRELNPYWKDGGDGLPPNLNEMRCDVKYLKDLLEKARDTSEVTGVPVEEIIAEEWGPVNKLKQIIQDAESGKSNFESIRRGSFEHSPSLGEAGNSLINEDSERRKGFIRPGEMSDFKYTNSYQRNWKKKETTGARNDKAVLDQSPGRREAEGKIIGESKKILTPDELNALAAKAMKAEIMGNKALCEQLRKEIEEAKKNREEAGASDRKTGKGKEEIIVLTKSNLRGMTKPCESLDYNISDDKGKRGKGETHKDNKRIRYFMDDDKHSLKSMFESEKFGTGDESDEMFLKMAKRGGKIGDGSDLDDDFLDQVRDSNYERKEKERERNRTINESKSKHKSLSHCRWCLDGNNIQKHLVVSVGSKCYLCLPSEESLTDGHCLIVPIHHDTCGTLLDEDVWNEVQSYRKRLCRMFEESGQDVVFFENARSFHRHPHMVLSCVPMDKEMGDLAPIYFKKAIMESETEWSNNKKVIELRDRDLRRSVPKGLSYFAVDFGTEGGFAHVIEDEKLFPWNFAEEIIGGMLDLDTHKWKKPRKESLENQKEKVAEFMEKWKKYEIADAKNRLACR